MAFRNQEILARLVEWADASDANADFASSCELGCIINEAREAIGPEQASPAQLACQGEYFPEDAS